MSAPSLFLVPPPVLPVAEPVPRRVPRHPVFLAAALALTAATVALRLYHQSTGYELFMDEIQYADVANSFAAGVGPKLFGTPFYLHPALFFAYVSAWIREPVGYPTVAFVLGLRPAMVVFAAANCLLVIAIARRLTGPRAALVAGALYALDPFIVRFDSRVMLEAPAMTGTLMGLAAALVGVERVGRARLMWLGGAGVAFGLAVTTKSTAALVTTLPLLLMCATAGGPRRREAAGMVAVQCTVYAGYVGWVASTGHLGDWFAQTLHGVLRAAGRPTTGFNAVGAPTLADRMLANITQFGPSYLLIAVAVAGIMVLLFEDVRERNHTGRHALLGGDTTVRMLTCWLGGVVLAIGYTYAFGELEEQTFYLMAVPSTIVIAVLVARMHLRTGRIVVAAGLVVVLAWSGQVWTTVHIGADDAYLRLVDHLAPLRGTGTVIALGEFTAQFVLPGFTLIPLNDSGIAPGARYALVSTQLSDLRLAPVSAATIATMDRLHPVVFTAHGRTVGDLRLYDLSVTRVPQGAHR